MAMHNAHKDTPDNAILADGCERCDQHAADPFASLDDSHLSRLYMMSQFGVDHDKPRATLNDSIAIKNLENVELQHNRLVRALLATGMVMNVRN